MQKKLNMHIKVWPYIHLNKNMSKKQQSFTPPNSQRHYVQYIHTLHVVMHVIHTSRYSLGSLLPLCYRNSFSLSSSPHRAHTHTHTHQYARGATAGFRHIGGAAQISVLILMGKGLQVQLQVTLGVTQEVEEIRKSPWKWRHHRHGNDEGDYVMFR